MKFPILTEHAEELLQRMENEGKIHSESGFLGEKHQTRYFAKALPDLSVLSADERAHVQNIAKRFEFWTASQMTAQTHEEYPWRTTPFGDVIPYELAFGLKNAAAGDARDPSPDQPE